MGAWGSGSFENDDALDWIGDLREGDSWLPVEQAFAALIADGVEYREAPDCSAAIAAAEILAAAFGLPGDDLPDSARVWLKRMAKPHAGLCAVAIEAIDAILDDSELKDLWEESDSYEEWVADVHALRARLAG